MAVLTVTGADGHSNLQYDPAVPGDLLEAEKKFNEAIGKGHVGYADGNLTTTFEPTAEHIVTAPIVVAG